MVWLLTLSSAVFLFAADAILEQEFGIYGDQMQSVAPAQRQSKHKFYSKNSKAITKRPVTQKNTSTSRTIGSNTQFQPKTMGSGSTLNRGYQSSTI